MRILITPDSYKGALTAGEAVRAIQSAVLAVHPGAQCDCLPLADGGEGTVEALGAACGGTCRSTTVSGLLGAHATAGWITLPDGTAVLEAASCLGWHLLPADHRDARRTRSDGLGALLDAAAAGVPDRHPTGVLCGLGGTLTNDCGYGLARTLGFRFTHAAGCDPRDVIGLLESVLSVVPAMDSFVQETRITALCDVRNPLCGPSGATHTYGPQKGVPATDLARMDAAVRHFAGIVCRDVRAVDIDAPHTGAAGGLGFALEAFCMARLVDGAAFILDAVHFDERCRWADLVITGEGRVDAQTAQGKLVAMVARRARALGTPVHCFAGRVEGDPEALCAQLGLTALHECTPRDVPEHALRAMAAEALQQRVMEVLS